MSETRRKTSRETAERSPEDAATAPEAPVQRSDEEWRRELTEQQYRVTRQKGTEPPFSGEYVECKEDGTYRCVCCGAALFSSETKYESGTGWPSFWEPVDESAVRFEDDSGHGMRRVEVLCNRCDAHLGHVFPDGPRPTGQRYCINSVALDLQAGDADAEGAKPE